MSDESTRILSRGQGPAPAPTSGDSAAPAPAPAPAPTDDATVVLTTSRPGGVTQPGMGFPTTGTMMPAAAAAAAAAQSSAPEVLPVGTRVGEFEVTGLVGQGGFGIVYQAWDHTLERVVALKEYLPSALAMRLADGTVTPRSEKHQETFDTGMRSFINEARLLAQFDHPSLLKVYRFWQDKGTTYMVMPFYRGQTLKQTLASQSSRPDEGWLRSVLDNVTQALAVMHGAQCYHRDIAPDNILLLEDSGLPVVLDFGAARRVISDMTQAITVILKPGYAPIEQYAETPDMKQGPWTDVYALGAVLYMAITGKTPVASVGRLMNDSYEPLLGRQPPLPYSESFLSAIDQALRVRPDERPQSMAALRALFGLESAVGSAASPTGNAAAGSVAGNAAGGASTMLGQRTGSGASAATSSRSASATASAPATAPTRSRTPLVAAAVAMALAVGGGLWWMSGSSDSASGGSADSGHGASTTTANAPATPTPPPKRAYSPGAVLDDMMAGASADIRVQVKLARNEVKIGQDKVSFTVESSRAGHLYVYLATADGHFNILFPNALDRHNQIEANRPLTLPRPAWALVAGGPPGTDRMVAVVSAAPRDHAEVGIQREDLFSLFPPTVAEAIDRAHLSGPSPFLGKTVCDAGAACETVYGAAEFSVLQRP